MDAEGFLPGSAWASDAGVDARADGRADLAAAVALVSAGAASAVLLCNFPMVDVLADDAGPDDSVVVEPRVRLGGGGFDVVVRRAAPIG